MNDIIKNIEAAQLREDAPQFNVGDTVKVYAKIKEGNRERIQVFEGTVLKKQGGSVRATFTVRKNSNGIEMCIRDRNIALTAVNINNASPNSTVRTAISYGYKYLGKMCIRDSQYPYRRGEK